MYRRLTRPDISFVDRLPVTFGGLDDETADVIDEEEAERRGHCLAKSTSPSSRNASGRSMSRHPSMGADPPTSTSVTA
ncbi:hypothetical protein [Nocardia salmonicida]|uniref:hypothetical protein n=1 Tax=Nocardia salmonicida TaxID=53431 RepID=UPI003633C8C2